MTGEVIGSQYRITTEAIPSQSTGEPEELTYQYIDDNPTLGINYYRLKQIDLDGKFNLSPVRSIDFNFEKNEGIKIFPNPTTDEFSILNFQGKGYMFSVEGRLVHVFESNSTISIDINHLPKGVYHILLEADNGEKENRVLVKE